MRAVDAAKAAIDSPLLEVSIDGARGILFTISASPNLSMNEVSEASRVITASADPNAKIIFGAVIDEALKDEVKITVVATGFGPSLTKSSAHTQETGAGRGQGFVRTTAPSATSRAVFQERHPLPPSREEEAQKAKEEEELEIPAFIRKKMT